jgi:hypothetical protein
VNQELAKEGIPLPFGNRFWASNWPTQCAPMPGLIIHLIPSVSRPVSLDENGRLTHTGKVIVIIAPPAKVAYPFILDVAGYPQQIVNLFITLVHSPLLNLLILVLLTLNRVCFISGGRNLTCPGHSKAFRSESIVILSIIDSSRSLAPSGIFLLIS